MGDPPPCRVTKQETSTLAETVGTNRPATRSRTAHSVADSVADRLTDRRAAAAPLL
jgi:hypothetical protein